LPVICTLPSVDFGLHGRRRMHFAVEDDDDLAVGGREILRGLRERRGAVGVELDVDGVVSRALRCAVDRDALDVVTGDERGVRARLDGERLLLIGGERVAEAVGDRLVAHVLAASDFALHGAVRERVQTGELELAGLADDVERVLGVGHARNLHENLVAALNLHDRLRRAEGVDAALDDRAALFHLVGGDVRAVRRVGREHDRQAALDVEALVDALVGGREHENRPDHEQRRENEEPDVAAVVRPGGAGALLCTCRHAV
jgi:hypothetical protein